MEKKKMTNYQKQCAYLAQLRAFQDHLNACFEVLMNTGATNETIDIFYNSDFEITFRGKKVSLANGADVFQAIEEIIQCEIDDCEEV
jgi:hypothetical protein